MSQIKKTLLAIFLCFTTVFSCPIQVYAASSSNSISFIILSKYSKNVNVGDEFYIIAITSTGSLPTWKSSNSKVASVNTYGKVTTKKSGTVTITAKIKKAEASCRVTVNKTIININKTNASIERGETFVLSASTSNNSKVTWKSSKSSIATIDEKGIVTGIKPGDTTITAACDGSFATCKIKVKAPTIKLSKTTVTLYRCQTVKLFATVSSGIAPVWKTDKKSVAVIDSSGTITAVKNGTATISATVDGVSCNCKVIVEKPSITLNSSELYLKKGKTALIEATVSSLNKPVWTSSNPSVANVDTTGKITALKKGIAYIYASEDGIKAKCTVHVTE
jgi:uncharacterized protein YjdB